MAREVKALPYITRVISPHGPIPFLRVCCPHGHHVSGFVAVLPLLTKLGRLCCFAEMPSMQDEQQNGDRQ